MKKEKEHIVLKGGAEEGRQEDRKVIEQKVLACVGKLEHELTALFLKKKASATTICFYDSVSCLFWCFCQQTKTDFISSHKNEKYI